MYTHITGCVVGSKALASTAAAPINSVGTDAAAASFLKKLYNSCF